jgi:hypothetical protein
VAKKQELPVDMGISWHDLSHRARSLISIDCEPNFVRAMLDRAVLTLGEDQIIEIENAIRSCDENTAKDIIYSQFINCIFDDVHVDEYIN